MDTESGPFQFGPDRYQPDLEFCYKNRSDYVISQQFLAALVGTVALLLPIVLYFGTWFGVCFYYSISHFYYTQFLGNVFVGALVFIGTFLIAYRGESRSENTLATIAGLCAYGVVLFPTNGAGCDMKRFAGRILADLQIVDLTGAIEVIKPDNSDRFFELFKNAALLHYASGTLLFLFLAYYCFFVFTRIIREQHVRANGKTLTWHKAIRNWIYMASGTVIVLCMIALTANPLHTYFTGNEWSWWDRSNYTFWLETFIVWAFGMSWITKGRFFGTALLDHRDRKQSPEAA